MAEKEITVESLPDLLRADTKVKVAGVDVDGVLRGKLMSKKKFLSIASDGFGFCSVIFGWDMHDQTYFKELKVSNKENGYRDIIAVPDLSTFRRIPWEENVPFFLVSFLDPDTRRPVSACPRGLLQTTLDKLHKQSFGAMAGGKQSLRFRLCQISSTWSALYSYLYALCSRVRILSVSSARPEQQTRHRAQLVIDGNVPQAKPCQFPPAANRRHVRLQSHETRTQSGLLLWRIRCL